MKDSLLDKFMTTKWLAWTFWTIVVVMVTALVFYTANLGKETPPIPGKVVYIDQTWKENVLYTWDDIAQGKAYFQQYDLTDWGSLMWMGAYLGPDFSTDFFHNRATILYSVYWKEQFNKLLLIEEAEQKHFIPKDDKGNYVREPVKFNNKVHLNDVEKWAIKEIVKADFRSSTFKKQIDKNWKVLKDEDNNDLYLVNYSKASAIAYRANLGYLINMLKNWDATRWYPGKIIKDWVATHWDTGEKIANVTAEEKIAKIAAFVDWSQLVVSSPRINKKTGEKMDRTWSNNWPNEPLVDQDLSWVNHVVSLWEFLLLWPFSILVVFLGYNYFFTKDDRKDLEKPLKVTKMFQSQKNLLWWVPVIALLIVVQMTMWGYLAHIYADPSINFLDTHWLLPWLDKFLSQENLPFNAIRSIHTQMAILWIAAGWLVWGLMIAPWVAGKDHKFPWLVHVLYGAILVLVVWSITWLYMGAMWMLPESWFWLGNEWRELINIARGWDFVLVVWLVFWFLLIVSLLKKASVSNPFAAVIVWSAFAIAWLYVAWMIPFHKIMPNFTVDDFYRWWVIHLWVELTFELFAVWVITFFTVALGLVSQKSAVKLMLFELLLVMLSGTMWVGHHYWWQGLDQHWIAIGWIFSALEPVPLVLLIVEAWNNYREKHFSDKGFEFGTVFMWISGSAVLNFIWAGWLGMVINTPTINYYTHGTYLIMPHGHVALLWAFGYIAIAFLYLVVRSNSLANKYVWKTKLANTGFWLLTIWVLLFALPTLIIGFHQWEVAYNMWYFFTRLHETLDPVTGWIWFRILPDTMMILGWVAIFWDLTSKILFSKKEEETWVIAKAKEVVSTVKKSVTKKATTAKKTTVKKASTVKKAPAKKAVAKKTTTKAKKTVTKK